MLFSLLLVLFVLKPPLCSIFFFFFFFLSFVLSFLLSFFFVLLPPAPQAPYYQLVMPGNQGAVPSLPKKLAIANADEWVQADVAEPQPVAQSPPKLELVQVPKVAINNDKRQ